MRGIEQLDELMSRRMTRKEFVLAVGMAILALFGVNNFISMLLKSSGRGSGKSGVGEVTDFGEGFGSRKFGR